MAASVHDTFPMRTQPPRIMFATERPLLALGYREILRRAAFDAEPSIVYPIAAAPMLRNDEPCLVFLDSEYEPAPAGLPQAVHRSQGSRLVLVGAEIKPRSVMFAFESGLHGVLSTRLPADEAAQTVRRIWQGERLFRFDCHELVRPASELSAAPDFDAAWMFGNAG